MATEVEQFDAPAQEDAPEASNKGQQKQNRNLKQKIFPEAYMSTTTKSKFEIPGPVKALYVMFTGKFLALRSYDDNQALDQIIGENTNLALICALLFTTFLPLYYQETTRLSIPDDGLTIDVSMGFFETYIVHLDHRFLRDFFDVAYAIAMCTMILGTLTSIHVILMANEAGTNRRVSIFGVKSSFVSKFALSFFVAGAFTWAASALFHLIITVQTIGGFIIKASTVAALLGCFTYAMIILCQSLYYAYKEEDDNPPIVYSEKELLLKLDEYCAEIDNSHEGKGVNMYDLDDFLKSLRKMSTTGFPVDITTMTKFDATRIFYLRIAKLKQMDYDQVVSLMATISK